MAAQQFRVMLGLKRSGQKDPVRFKVDGGRFESERTLKLNVNTPYDVELSFKPAQRIERLNVQGGNVTPEEKKREASGSVYQANWVTSGFDANRKGGRVQVPIIVNLEPQMELKITLQCKFYSENEANHVTWGNMVNYIEYECKRPEGSNFVEIVKETFR